MSGLSLRGLTVSRAGRVVVEDASFTAPAGGITAILGAAGAGKTSLLAACAGLLPSDRGAVLVAGRDVSGLAARRRGVAFLTPGTALATRRLTADAVRKLGGDAAALALLGGTGVLKRRADTLSYGEGLLALTAARLGVGSVLLVDEAGAGLGEDSRQALTSLLRQRARDGCAVVLATREAAVAHSADQLVLLRDGRVLQTGTPASVYAEPRCAGAAQLGGPVNILAGTIRELRPGGFVWAAGGRFVQAVDPATVRPVLGTEVTLCLRPERLVLLPEGAVADNAVQGQVEDVRAACGILDVRLASALGALRVFSPSWQPAIYPAKGLVLRVGWAADAGFVVGGA